MKSTVTLLLAALAVLAIFSCNKKDDSGDSNLKVKIIGTWDEQVLYTYWYKNGEPYEMDTTIEEAGTYDKFEFKSDQTFVYSSGSDGDEETATGAYKINGNKLLIFGFDPLNQSTTDTSVVICEINGTQMIWTQEATISGTNGEQDLLGVKVYFTKEN